MIDVLRWLVAIELIGVAFLPWNYRLFRRFPDGGYPFAKILGLLLATYVEWLIGSSLPLAGGPWLLALAIVAFGLLGWLLFGADTLSWIGRARGILATEEGIFLAAFVAWCLLRAFVFHPTINHTEQFMDMSLLGASLHSSSYPPYDPWLSGHSLNYYYFGYLLMAGPIKLSGVSPTVGYNLALSLLFALTVACSYCLGYVLTRNRLTALLAPLFVALLGNWHAPLVQVPQGHLPSNSNWWFWDSTRVIGGTGDYTINEFPVFSFYLGDLHPHVIALPLTLLAIAVGLRFLFHDSDVRKGRALGNRPIPRPGRRNEMGAVLVTALCLGSLYATNSWDFPTYLAAVAAFLLVAAYLRARSTSWWRRPLATAGGMAVLSVVLFLPFYLRFRSPAQGIGLVSTHSNIWQWLQVWGLMLVPTVLLLVLLWLLLQPAPPETDSGDVVTAETEKASDEGGHFAEVVSILGAIVLGIAFHLWALIILLAMIYLALTVLWRVLNTESPNRGDSAAIALIGIASGVLAVTELFYLRDAFAGSASYRMNTVFKAYYQAWLMLGVASSFAVSRIWQVAGRLFGRGWAFASAALLGVTVLLSSVYPVLTLSNPITNSHDQGLDGEAWLRSEHPGDYAAILWLRRHAPADSVIIESSGPDFSYSSRISTFTGLRTVLGWAGHEGQWRGSDPAIAQRTADLSSLYTTRSVGRVRQIVRKYGARYVIVGPTDVSAYPPPKAGHTPVLEHALKPVFTSGGTTIYTL